MSENKYDLTNFDKVSADVAILKDEGNFIPDCSTKAGYEASKRFCLDRTIKSKNALTDAHKKTKAPFLETCQFLDKKKRELMFILDEIESPHKLAYKAYDEEKKQRNARFEKAIRDKIQILIDYKAEAIGKTSDEIEKLILACRDTNIEAGFFHLKENAKVARQTSLEVLNISLMQANKAEEAAEQLKAANTKHLENDYEVAWLLNDKFDRDSADRLAEQKEKQRIDDEANALRNEAEAAERARQQEIERHEQERERLEREEKQRTENKEHVEKIDKAIVQALIRYCDVTDKQALSFIESIMNDYIPNVTIKY